MFASILNLVVKPQPLEVGLWIRIMIGKICPPLTKKHNFILITTDYFAKWVETTSYKNTTKRDNENVYKIEYIQSVQYS